MGKSNHSIISFRIYIIPFHSIPCSVHKLVFGWLRQSFNNRMAITEYEHYEYPLNAKTLKPLRGCILNVSGFDEEQTFYEHLAVAAGAIIDDSYRKHMKVLLILCSVNFKKNAKYLAALKWGRTFNQSIDICDICVFHSTNSILFFLFLFSFSLSYRKASCSHRLAHRLLSQRKTSANRTISDGRAGIIGNCGAWNTNSTFIRATSLR